MKFQRAGACPPNLPDTCGGLCPTTGAYMAQRPLHGHADWKNPKKLPRKTILSFTRSALTLQSANPRMFDQLSDRVEAAMEAVLAKIWQTAGQPPFPEPELDEYAASVSALLGWVVCII